MNEISLNLGTSEFCETPTAKKLLRVLTISSDAPDMGIGLIVGAAGVGKTTAIKYFAAQRENVHVVTMNGTATTMTNALSIICRELMGYDERTPRAMNEMIVNFFHFRRASRVLIIDEAQELNDAIINQLRHIYDETGAGLVLCGNAAFRNRFNHAEASAFAQVTSRIGIRADIPGPSEEDIEAICEFRKITGSAERELILHYSRSSGALRTVTKLIDMASAVAIDEPLAIQHLHAAAAMLGFDR